MVNIRNGLDRIVGIEPAGQNGEYYSWFGQSGEY